MNLDYCDITISRFFWQQWATDEKFTLEEAQRARAKEHKTNGTEHIPRYFELLDSVTGQYVYKNADLRPWDPMNDLYQYERDYKICTKTKHKTPLIRTQSIVSVSEAKQAGSAATGGTSGAASTAASGSSRRRKVRGGGGDPGSTTASSTVNGEVIACSR